MLKENKTETLPAIRVSSEVRKSLETLASQDNRNLSDFIRVQLSKLVESSKHKS